MTAEALGSGFKRVSRRVKAAGRPVGKPVEKPLKLSGGIMMTWISRVPMEDLTQEVLN